MGKVFHIYVEKNDKNNIEARQLAQDLRENAGFSNVKNVRVVNRYFVEGISEEDFRRAKKTVFAEPAVDSYYSEFKAGEGWRFFAYEYLPGQYDQRADNAAQCIQLLTEKDRPRVKSAKIIALEGDIDDAELEKIENYIINPVDSRVASMEIPDTLEQKRAEPEKVKKFDGFKEFDDDKIKKCHDEMDFAMSVQDLAWVRDYFKSEDRDPSVTELKVIDTYWSDHCRHTTFATSLDKIEVEKSDYSEAIENAIKEYFKIRKNLYGNKDKTVCLMDLACIGAKELKKEGYADNLDESEEINACSIEVPVKINGKTQKWLVQFKNETHNHPTEIEPFGGAATCLGGAIRDPLSGRAYVYQAMRVTGSADPTTPVSETLEGKLPQRKITIGAAQGYSSYGNQIGLATGQVQELYDEGYVAKRMEIGAVIGASPKDNVKRLSPEPGDKVILLGGRTGRDGCGGATGSSKAHNTQSIEKDGAEVQKGTAPTERKLQRLFRNPAAAKMIKRCNDFGAGGVSVAIGELADGLDINLDKVPKKYDGLDGTELAISESQERMAVVLSPGDVEKFISLADRENLEATVVADVTDTGRLKMTWRGDLIVDLSREFLNTNGVTQHADALIGAVFEKDNYRNKIPEELSGKTLGEALKANLSRLEVACQKGLAERFDSSIGANTVLMPFAGKYQLTPEDAMAAKLPIDRGESDDCTVMAYGFIPKMSKWSPFHSAAYAVSESLAKLACVGCDTSEARLTFQEYFQRMTDDPKGWGLPAAALLGALGAQIGYKTPSIGGKDSMSGSFNDLNVPPTLVSFAVGMSRASETVSAIFKKANPRVVVIPLPVNPVTALPDYEKARRLYATVAKYVREGKILAASTVKEGGAAACVCKMAFGDKRGFEFRDDLDAETLFAAKQGSIVAQVAPEFDLECEELGRVTDDSVFRIGGEEISTDELIKIWMSKLEDVFPTDSRVKAEMPRNITSRDFDNKKIYVNRHKVPRPRVFIPVFPGTNCEYDTKRAFQKAGADVDVFVIRNLNPDAIKDSISQMSKCIEKAQIIMLPGGFSAADEPEGSGKFIATTFRNEKLKKAVKNLLSRRDGLMLGICNGFQALIKLGLVPYGEITEPKRTSPTLTFNTIGRHISSMAYTKVVSNKSPWLRLASEDTIYSVPISHGEGRFFASADLVKTLARNRQIATQYVDPEGNPVADMPFNPNGSVCAIEGITSLDGRVFGKMAHVERKGANVYKNVPFEKDMKIFESGVSYFK